MMGIEHKIKTGKTRMMTMVAGFALLAALISASRAEAADFGVRVVDEAGNPVDNASVCVGTPANYEQFGIYRTAADGHVMIRDLPRTPVTVTISDSDGSSVDFEQPVLTWNLIREVRLTSDDRGPLCQDHSRLADVAAQQLAIKDLSVTRNGQSYTLISVIEGNPSHYRISADTGFRDAKWQPYQKRIHYRGTTQGTLYFQVKRFSGSKNAWLEKRSPVANILVN